MTPKEKAFELYEKHLRYTPVEFEEEYTKKACIITIEETLKVISSGSHYEFFYTAVKEEVEKL